MVRRGPKEVVEVKGGCAKVAGGWRRSNESGGGGGAGGCQCRGGGRLLGKARPREGSQTLTLGERL